MRPYSPSQRVADYRLSARKNLGQHFLLDVNLTRRIVKTAGDLTGKTVVEIGPGAGSLTLAILETGLRKLIAVEQDHRCVEALQDLVRQDHRLHLIEQDARVFSMRNLSEDGIMIIANLPYNIATFLLLRWLEDTSSIQRMILMFQKEVAERLLAQPGKKAYGRLSVLAQWQWDIRKLMAIPARAFTPSPKVDSTLISLTPHQGVFVPSIKAASLSKVTKAAFGQRRKMLRRSLRSLGAQGVLLAETAGIDLRRRGETLTIKEFCALAQALETLPSEGSLSPGTTPLGKP